MFYALPAETVIEAKERTKRATALLFTLLVALYIFFTDLLVIVSYFHFRYWPRYGGEYGLKRTEELWTLLAVATTAAILAAVLHFLFVRAKRLEDMLGQLKARPADLKDDYHATFIRTVQEAEAATGIHGIRPVVLATIGCNAFSLQDGKGRCAIGVTEGLLSRLNRQELSAVVAHEAAHLVHEDSRLVTTACFLFSVFGLVNSGLGQVMRSTSNSSSRGSSRGRGGISGLILILWIVSGVGYLITRLITMAISREREYLADADGVAMCKDPFAMAEALEKISNKFRGDTPSTYSALFILNTANSPMDETEGFLPNLFSTHPPVSKRLEKLLAWAKSDLKTLQERQKLEKSQETPVVIGPSTPAPEPFFMAFQNNQWIGPYTPLQMLSTGLMSPSTWICPAGSQQVAKASETPELLPLFQKQVKGSVSLNDCPRCKVPLLHVTYEGAQVAQCSFCKGYLLKAGVLERIILREDKVFSADEIMKAKNWRDIQKGNLTVRDHFPDIRCPYCKSPMCKGIHTMLTQVVVDHCSNYACCAIWCDAGELETIQMLVEDAHKVQF
jgi:heat shock protein HtpX